MTSTPFRTSIPQHDEPGRGLDVELAVNNPTDHLGQPCGWLGFLYAERGAAVLDADGLRRLAAACLIAAAELDEIDAE